MSDVCLFLVELLVSFEMFYNNMSAYTSDISDTWCSSIHGAHAQEKNRSKCRWGRTDDLRQEMRHEYISANEQVTHYTTAINNTRYGQAQARILEAHLPDSETP